MIFGGNFFSDQSWHRSTDCISENFSGPFHPNTYLMLCMLTPNCRLTRDTPVEMESLTLASMPDLLSGTEDFPHPNMALPTLLRNDGSSGVELKAG